MSHQQPREEPAEGPLVSATDVVAAGLASVTVATLSSKLGVDGTLLGAELASMAETANVLLGVDDAQQFQCQLPSPHQKGGTTK